MSRLHLLAVLLPVLCGIVLPTMAFDRAQVGFTPGEDSDTDVMAQRAREALPVVTITTLPGFALLSAFLLVYRKRITGPILWSASIAGVLLMSIVVWNVHIDMYTLLYARGRMHSTAPVGMLFTSLGCVALAMVIGGVALVTDRWRRKKSGLKET